MLRVGSDIVCAIRHMFPAHHIIVAGWDLDDLLIDRDGVLDFLCEKGCFPTCPHVGDITIYS